MKLEKFTKNKKEKRILIGSVVGILMLIGGLFLYKTYAFYEEEKEFNVLKGTIPKFEDADIELSLTLDGKNVESYPEKGNYSVNITCDQNAIGSWDYSTWSVNISNLKATKIKCKVQFETNYIEEILNGATPEIKEDLIPVIIDEENGTVTKADVKKAWYNYENKKWANAVILTNEGKQKEYKAGNTIEESDIESYFVWIPKYSYKLWDLGNYATQTGLDTNKSHAIEIKFGNANTIENDTECITPNKSGESGNCTVGKYMTHPAFISFEGVKGLWVGKFEMTGELNNLTTKPNIKALRNYNLSTLFKEAYNYKRNLDSHMIKNTEWGAIVYLAHSNYGFCTNGECQEVSINSNPNYITGYLGQSTPYYNSASGLASSTGNHSGIYDLNGCVDEHVAGVRGSINSGSAGFSSSDNYPTKYFDFYNTNTNDRGNHTTRILGDATGELGPFSNYMSSWYNDWAESNDASYPWFERGGNAINHIHYNPGIFYASRNDGNGNGNGIGASSRIILAPVN